MSSSPFLAPFDLDVTLRDASLDPDNRPTRRMIANASIGMAADDAYYSVREVREAVNWVHEGVIGSKRKLASILSNDGDDDYQRCIFYNLAGRGIAEMLDDLMWLEGLLEGRGRVAGQMLRERVQVMPLVAPYVASAPDGPVGTVKDDFEQGPSWWIDPSIIN